MYVYVYKYKYRYKYIRIYIHTREERCIIYGAMVLLSRVSFTSDRGGAIHMYAHI